MCSSNCTAKLGELASEEHVRYWLRRVTVHRSIDRVRRRQRQPEVPMDWQELPELPDLSNTAGRARSAAQPLAAAARQLASGCSQNGSRSALPGRHEPGRDQPGA